MIKYRNPIRDRDLPTINGKLSLNELRATILLAQHYSNLKPFEPICINSKDYADLFRVTPQNSSNQLRKITTSLKDKVITTSNATSKLFNCISNNRELNNITFTPSQTGAELLKYIKHCTQGKNLGFITQLNSVYHIRLYMWLKHAKRFHKNADKSFRPILLNYQWIKQSLGTENQTIKCDTFKHSIIKPALEKINEITDICASCETIIEKRTSSGLAFLLNHKGDN
ncbi:replication initiation protein [Vibrio parahaemolyticus]|nr:replication initiation protein [Vibrio parahaemolyticus]